MESPFSAPRLARDFYINNNSWASDSSEEQASGNAVNNDLQFQASDPADLQGGQASRRHGAFDLLSRGQATTLKVAAVPDPSSPGQTVSSADNKDLHVQEAPDPQSCEQAMMAAGAEEKFLQIKPQASDSNGQAAPVPVINDSVPSQCDGQANDDVDDNLPTTPHGALIKHRSKLLVKMHFPCQRRFLQDAKASPSLSTLTASQSSISSSVHVTQFKRTLPSTSSQASPNITSPSSSSIISTNSSAASALSHPKNGQQAPLLKLPYGLGTTKAPSCQGQPQHEASNSFLLASSPSRAPAAYSNLAFVHENSQLPTTYPRHNADKNPPFMDKTPMLDSKAFKVNSPCLQPHELTIPWLPQLTILPLLLVGDIGIPLQASQSQSQPHSKETLGKEQHCSHCGQSQHTFHTLRRASPSLGSFRLRGRNDLYQAQASKTLARQPRKPFKCPNRVRCKMKDKDDADEVGMPQCTSESDLQSYHVVMH